MKKRVANRRSAKLCRFYFLTSFQGCPHKFFDRCITKCYTVPQGGLGRCFAKFIRAIQTCHRIGPDAWRGFRDSSPTAWNSPIVTIVTSAFPSCRGLKFVWRERSATKRSEKRQHRVMSLSQNTSCWFQVAGILMDIQQKKEQNEPFVDS